MILIKPGDHAAPIPLRLHTGQTMAAKNTNRCSLHVEWTEGAERRYGSPPVVIVDGQPVGAVDQLIAISPGDHRVRVRRERATTDEIQVTVPPSRTFVLHYESSEVSPIFHGAMTAIALVTSLVIYWVFDVGAFEREETLRNKLIAAAGIGVVVLAHRCLSPYFFRGTLKAGRPASPSARLMVNLIAAPRPKVLIDGKVAGAVADVLRVRPGERHVRVRGWVDHSDEIAIYAAAGQLVELEASRTSSGSLAAVATALPFIAAIFSMFYFDLDWTLPLLIGGAAASLAMSFLFSRLAPTMTLDFKST